MNRFSFPILLLLFCCAGIWASCGSSVEKDPVDLLMAEVMAVHDEVMPQMGNMAKLEKDLRKEVEQLEQSEAPDTQAIDEMKQGIQALKSANEGMMQWMRDFSPPDKEDESAALSYLGEQLTSIRSVSKDMKSSMERANQLLQK